MKEAFYNYLLELGYKDSTPSGAPSTISHYINSIEKIIAWEHLGTWNQLIQHLPILLRKYDLGGEKAHLGSIGHGTVINALRRFAEFVASEIKN